MKFLFVALAFASLQYESVQRSTREMYYYRPYYAQAMYQPYSNPVQSLNGHRSYDSRTIFESNANEDISVKLVNFDIIVLFLHTCDFDEMCVVIVF